MTPGHVDRRAIELAFDALLAQHPSSLVAAVNRDGMFVPVPETFSIDRSRILQARSALDFVVADDRLQVIDGWYRAVDNGVSRTEVRLAATPDRATQLYLFDLLARHGTYFCVVLLPVGAEEIRPEAVEGMASRVTWAIKTDRAAFRDVDPGIERMFGWTRDELLWRSSLDLVHPDDQELAIDNWMSMVSSGGDGKRVRLRHLHKDGHHVWLEVVNKNRLDQDPPHVFAEMIDISDEMAAQEALREREQLLHRLAEALPSGLLHVLVDGRVMYTNERLHEIVAVGRRQHLSDQLDTIVADDRAAFEHGLAAVLGGDDAEVELRVRHPGAPELRQCRFTMRSLSEPDGTVNGAIISVADVTESASLRRQLEERATIDSLTRCHNRAATMQALDERIGRADERTAVIFVDLDRFKPVNDELGHAAGDELLVTIADRLRAGVGPDDLVGRLGGDEFLVVLGAASSGDAEGVADRIADAVCGEVRLEGGNVEAQASVGVAVADRTVTSADDLVARADSAMYESKRRGTGRPVSYSSRMKRSAVAGRHDDRRELHDAVEHGSFVVHFQPVVDLRSGGPIGYESVVRWFDAGGTALDVAASEIIGIAEEAGIIHALGATVRGALVAAAAKHVDAVAGAARWFTDVSAQELRDPELVGAVAPIIGTHGIGRGQLVAQVRFDAASSGDPAVLSSLEGLRAVGVDIALDDFGGGWASLELLRAAAPTWVKLAPVLTAAAPDDPFTNGVLRSTIELARRIGSTPIAEDVATSDQRDLLVGLGVEVGQGRLLGVPAPLDALLGPADRRVKPDC